MVPVAQLVRASGCGSEGRGFKSHQAPQRILFASKLKANHPFTSAIIIT